MTDREYWNQMGLAKSPLEQAYYYLSRIEEELHKDHEGDPTFLFNRIFFDLPPKSPKEAYAMATAIEAHDRLLSWYTKLISALAFRIRTNCVNSTWLEVKEFSEIRLSEIYQFEQ